MRIQTYNNYDMTYFPVETAARRTSVEIHSVAYENESEGRWVAEFLQHHSNFTIEANLQDEIDLERIGAYNLENELTQWATRKIAEYEGLEVTKWAQSPSTFEREGRNVRNVGFQDWTKGEAGRWSLLVAMVTDQDRLFREHFYAEASQLLFMLDSMTRKAKFREDFINQGIWPTANEVKLAIKGSSHSKEELNFRGFDEHQPRVNGALFGPGGRYDRAMVTVDICPWAADPGMPSDPYIMAAA